MSAAAPGARGEPPADLMQATAARIESLLEASAAGGPAAHARAEDLVSALSTLYGSGLQRLLEILDETGALAPAVVDSIAGDELVSGLLLVHDLHPYDVTARVRRALDSVRPYLGTHGGDVELVGIDADGVATLRLLGSCDGCPSSSVTLELAVDGAVRAAAPELTGIEVQAGPPEPSAGSLISLDSLRTRIDRPPEQQVQGTWVALPELADLTPGEVGGFEVDGVPLCACRIGTDLFCFRDRCGHCGQGLAGAVVERQLGAAPGTAVLRCGRCRAHFDVRRAGAGLDDPEEHLEPLPVLVRDGAISVAIPAAVS